MLITTVIYLAVGIATVRTTEQVKGELAPLDVKIILTLMWPVVMLILLYVKLKKGR